ncbi:MAG: hypothetical protein LH473_02405, partial [Chitinophagales bacterium]|nr:hypothetical protein [Chitinophagales bacterium]
MGNNDKDWEKEFFNRADFLMNHLCLIVGENAYRVVDCEVYYHSEEHPDPYVHKGEEQLNNGTWFFNDAGGLDITFGNGEKGIYAGILIRTIQNLKTEQRIEGIIKVVKEIFRNLGNIFSEGNEIRLCELNPQFITQGKPYTTTRVNLTERINDMERFFNKYYRFLILSSAMKGKDKILSSLIQDKQISKEDAIKILGYN